MIDIKRTVPYSSNLGLRNILIKDFRSLDLRQDRGHVFENFVVSEIFKKIKNNKLLVTPYFYREYGGAEVDLVLEDYKKQYRVFEIKLNQIKKINSVFPHKHKFDIISSVNYFQVINHL